MFTKYILLVGASHREQFIVSQNILKEMLHMCCTVQERVDTYRVRSASDGN